MHRLSLTEKVFDFDTIASGGELISMLVPNAHETDDELIAKASAFGRKLAEV